MRDRIARRITLIAILLAFTIAMGTAGFVWIERYPVFDAFYMTLITISTVGYGEVHPLSQAGRYFNSFLILFGVSVMFFSVGAITQIVIELELQDPFGKRRSKRMIDQLEKHVIICGFGRVGRSVAHELQSAGAPFVVIDRNEERVERAMAAGIIAFAADATRDEALRAAGVSRAIGLVSALATDADNLFVILSAKSLNPKLNVVTRAAEEEAEEKLRRAGADTVFAPYTITGHRLAQSILRPHVSRFLDFTTQTMGLDVAIEQIQVSAGTEFASKTLREMQLRRELGIIVLAIRKPGGQMIFNPPADMEMSPGDFLIAMGEVPNLQRLERLLLGEER
ncbi:potassium channel family protein [Nevskia soli]|uniref:potassium channel family protein n=1 Tax=Nevskia soli TaxID=418856 RepID=UPI0015D874DD|nr:potassium channel protein [Nevskia soli]